MGSLCVLFVRPFVPYIYISINQGAIGQGLVVVAKLCIVGNMSVATLSSVWDWNCSGGAAEALYFVTAVLWAISYVLQFIAAVHGVVMSYWTI